MKKIVLDVRMINNSGIGVYIQNYLDFILKSKKYKVVLLGIREVLEKRYSEDTFEIIEVNFPIYSLKEQLFLPFLIPKCDIYWSPNYNLPVFPILAKKIIVTIPDTAHLTLSKEFGFGLIKKTYAKIVLKIAVAKASVITTISYFSKDEIIRHSVMAKRKIEVIYLGVNKKIFKKIDDKTKLSATSSKYNLPERYILFVGNVKPHKNLRKLVEAFEEIILKDDNINIVIVGKKDGFITGDSQLFDCIKNNLALDKKIIFTGYVEEADLPLIYSLATIFVFPSLYEGFGFPPLEAMASGCPVVASNGGSIPEICKDNVIYVDPFNSNSIAQGITQLLIDKNMRDELKVKGLKYVQKFDWQDSSSKFMKIIDLI